MCHITTERAGAASTGTRGTFPWLHGSIRDKIHSPKPRQASRKACYSWSSQNQNPGTAPHTQYIIPHGPNSGLPFSSFSMYVKCWKYKSAWAQSLTSKSWETQTRQMSPFLFLPSNFFRGRNGGYAIQWGGGITNLILEPVLLIALILFTLL